MSKKILAPLENLNYKQIKVRKRKFLTGFIFLTISLVFGFLIFGFQKAEASWQEKFPCTKTGSCGIAICDKTGCPDGGAHTCTYTCPDRNNATVVQGGCVKGGCVCIGSNCKDDPGICSESECTYTCELGWGNCNGNDLDGCETDTNTDGDHCGDCNTSCAGVCVGGECALLPAGKVYGWAWSKNIGWISFDCSNTDSCASVDYGVEIDVVSGNFSGHAWSENIGWIDFAPAGSYPVCSFGTCPTGSPNYPACLDLPGGAQVCEGVGDYTVSGWARACSVFQSGCSGALKPDSERGGWNGWILLGPINKEGTDYGVTLNSGAEEFEGWAWSDDIGWISFNCNNPESGDVCGGSDYKVRYDTPTYNPTVSNPTSTPYECCYEGCAQARAAQGYSIELSWTYHDDDNPADEQYSYEIWLDDDSNFLDPNFYYTAISDAHSYTLVLFDDIDCPLDCWRGGSDLAWDTEYYWKVRVTDTKGGVSEWSEVDTVDCPNGLYGCFHTPENAYPNTKFTWSPQLPGVYRQVKFDDLSECYDASNNIIVCDSWYWTFSDAGPNSSIDQNPVTQFTSIGVSTVELDTSDPNGYNCNCSNNVSVTHPLPRWREIPPFELP